MCCCVQFLSCLELVFFETFYEVFRVFDLFVFFCSKLFTIGRGSMARSKAEEKRKRLFEKYISALCQQSMLSHSCYYESSCGIYICSLKNTTITCKESQVKQSLGRRRESDTLVRSFKQRSISKQGVTQTHRCNSQLVVFCSCCCMPLLFSCHIYYKMSKF